MLNQTIANKINSFFDNEEKRIDEILIENKGLPSDYDILIEKGIKNFDIIMDHENLNPNRFSESFDKFETNMIKKHGNKEIAIIELLKKYKEKIKEILKIKNNSTIIERKDKLDKKITDIKNMYEKKEPQTKIKI